MSFNGEAHGGLYCLTASSMLTRSRCDSDLRKDNARKETQQLQLSGVEMTCTNYMNFPVSVTCREEFSMYVVMGDLRASISYVIIG